MELSQQNEQIRQFMKLLEEQNRSGQAQDLSRLLFYMDGMERQFDAVLQELQAVKAQLHEAQKSPVKKALDSMAQGLEDKVSRARERILELRERLAACAASAVEGFKQAGISALDKAVSLLGIHKTLDALQQDMGGLMADTQRAIEKVETMGHELRSAGSHLKNAGRSLTGKDTRQVDGGQEGRLQAAVLAPPAHHPPDLQPDEQRHPCRHRQCGTAGTSGGPGPGEKTSIRQELQEKKAEAAARPAPAPEREKKAPEASL